MLRPESLELLQSALAGVYKIINELKIEAAPNQDPLELYRKLDFIGVTINDIQTQFQNFKFTVGLHGAVSFHLSDRYYVYISERYGKTNLPSIYALQDANGPWHDLGFAVKHWRRMTDNNEKNKSKGRGSIKYAIMRYQPKFGNLVEVPIEDIQKVEAALEAKKSTIL